MVRDITNIVINNNIPSVARVNHRNGVMEVRQDFANLDNTYKAFVFNHERGHLVLNTQNEYAADNFAMHELLKQGYPLTKILQSLTQTLSYNNAEHYGRTVNLFENLKNYDYHVNGNKKITPTKNKTMTTPNLIYEHSIKNNTDPVYSNFAWFAAVPKVLGALGGMFGNKGGGDGEDQNAQMQQMLMMQQQQQIEAENKKKNTMYIIGAVVLLVVIIIFFMMSKK
ncbi:MAG: hypothetical protein K0B10_07170 [Vicingaceae bacterium]|nr:hypothetical protein [Vicingaceae bacterium]